MGEMIIPDDTALVNFFKTGRPVYASKGEVILRGDEAEPSVFLIGKGHVKVYSINDTGEEYLHVIYRPGEIFPLIWAFKDIRRRVFYEAISSSVLWKLPKDKLLAEVDKESSPIISDLLMLLVDQFHIYADRLDNLQYRSAYQRVVYRLLFLASRFGKKKGGDIIIDAPMSHKLIAQSINLTRESVSREIEKLAAAGLADTSNGHIAIKDAAKLCQEFDEPISLDYWGFQ